MSVKKRPDKNALNSYVRYSGYVFQMAGTILAFVLIGKYIDHQMENEKLIATAILSVLGVGISLYNLIRSVRNVK